MKRKNIMGGARSNSSDASCIESALRRDASLSAEQYLF